MAVWFAGQSYDNTPRRSPHRQHSQVRVITRPLYRQVLAVVVPRQLNSYALRSRRDCIRRSLRVFFLLHFTNASQHRLTLFLFWWVEWGLLWHCLPCLSNFHRSRLADTALPLNLSYVYPSKHLKIYLISWGRGHGTFVTVWSLHASYKWTYCLPQLPSGLFPHQHVLMFIDNLISIAVTTVVLYTSTVAWQYCEHDSNQCSNNSDCSSTSVGISSSIL